jgi:hypothetical protein
VLKKAKYPLQKLTNEDKQILDQIVIKYALKFFALTEKYPNPKQYAEQVILKRMRYDTNIAILYSISYVSTNPSDYLYKAGQLNEQIANDIHNTIIESYPTLALEDNNSSKGFLDPRDFRERVTKKLEDAGIFLHLEGKNAIKSQEHKTRRPGIKRSSDEVHEDHGGKPSAYIITEEVEKLKKTIEKPGAIEYVCEKIMSSNLPHRFAKFSLLAFFHIAKLDEVSLHKLMGIGEVMMNDDRKQIDKSELVNFQRFLHRFDDYQLEQLAENGAQLLIKESNYHVLSFFLAGLSKI